MKDIYFHFKSDCYHLIRQTFFWTNQASCFVWRRSLAKFRSNYQGHLKSQKKVVAKSNFFEEKKNTLGILLMSFT